MRHGVTKSVVVAFLLPGFLMAGCLDQISDKLEPVEEDPEEPHKRLNHIIRPVFTGGTCVKIDTNIPTVLGPNCVDIIPTFGETKCDPAQLWVTDKNDPMNLEGMYYDSVEEAREAQKGVEAPENSYLYCEIELDWQFIGRSLMHDSTLSVVHETHNRTFEETCQISAQSECEIELNYVTNLSVNLDKESETHEEWGGVEIEWFEPLLHQMHKSELVFESEFWLGVD